MDQKQSTVGAKGCPESKDEHRIEQNDANGMKVVKLHDN